MITQRTTDRARVAWPCVVAALLLSLGVGAPPAAADSAGLSAAEMAAQDRYRLDEKEDWRKQAELDPASPEGQLLAIRRLIADDKPKDAKEAADRWIKTYPNHPQLVEAYLLRGDARVAKGSEYKALQDYEYVIRQYPGSEQFNTALEREYELARIYSSGRKREFLGMRIISASGEAEEIFIRIQERAPGSELGEKASMTLGDHYYNRGEMDRAAEAYDLFLLNYPRSQYRERAMLRQIQSNLARFKGPQFDSTGLLEADIRIRQYQKEYPASAERIGADALLVRIDESLALKTLNTAHWYRIRREYVGRVTMLRRVVRDHPQTTAARVAMQELTSLDEPLVDGRAPTRPVREVVEQSPDTLRVPAGTETPADGGDEQTPEQEPLR